MSKRKSRHSADKRDPYQAREAKKYANPIPSREFILSLLEDNAAPLRYNEIATALELDDEERREADSAAKVARATVTLREAQVTAADAAVQQAKLRVATAKRLLDEMTIRAPIDGTVLFRDYRPGKFLNAMGAEASRQNECSLIGIERADGTRVFVEFTADWCPTCKQLEAEVRS